MRSGMHRFDLLSLRARYIFTAVIFIVVLLASVWWANRHVMATGYLSTARMNTLNAIQSQNLTIRDAVWEAEFSLNRFLHLPSESEKTSVRDKLALAVELVEKFAATEWGEIPDNHRKLELLRSSIFAMQEKSNELMDIREDREKRFPGMSTIISALYPASLEFSTASSLVLDKDYSDTGEDSALEDALFQEAQRLWGRMIETFRIFLTYRTEMIGDPATGMPVEAGNIKLLYEAMSSKLEALKTLRARDGLSFQGSASLDQMLRISKKWYAGFEHISRILSNDTWRQDDLMIREQVQPLSAEIRDRLRQLEASIKASSSREREALAQLSRSVIQAIWFLGGLVLLLAAGWFVYLDRGLLRPVFQVSEALKRQTGKGAGTRQLPVPQTRESQDLVLAFNQLVASLESAEINRAQAEAAARHAVKMSMVGEMASCVAHEINNPLNNMMRVIEFLEQDLGDEASIAETTREDLAVLRQEQKRCAVIVQNLLDFGRPMPPSVTVVNPLVLIQESVRLLSRTAQKKGISIIVDSEGTLPLVRVDSGQIQQVLVNLLLNAIEAGPKQSEIRVLWQRMTHGFLKCLVQDQGAGVTPHEIDQLFDPFFSNKLNQRGMGLGLSVSRSIVEHHGGTMGAEIEPEGGFLVWFTMPLGMGI